MDLWCGAVAIRLAASKLAGNMSCAAHGLCAEERATNLPEGQRAGGLLGRGVQEILLPMLDRRSNMAGVDPSNIYSRFHLAPMASISPL